LGKDSGGSKKTGGLTGGLIPLGAGGPKLAKEPSDFDFDKDDLSPASNGSGGKGFDSAFSDLLSKPTTKGVRRRVCPSVNPVVIIVHPHAPILPLMFALYIHTLESNVPLVT
jgi:hypothetical protein